LEIEYKYRVFLKKKTDFRAITTTESLTFYAPAHKGEKVILASHLKKLKEMPDWVLHVNTWLVKDVVHVAEKSEGLVKEGTILILIPSGLPNPGY
jgi:hypothetical protein